MADVSTPISGRMSIHPGSAGSERKMFTTTNNCNVKQQLFPNVRYQNLKPHIITDTHNTPNKPAGKPQLGKLYLDTKTNMVSLVDPQP